MRPARNRPGRPSAVRSRETAGVPPTRAPQIEALFEVDVRAADLVGEGDERWLLPPEAAHVAGAVPARRADFAAGRSCARFALGELASVDARWNGLDSQVIVANPDRSPCWPPGITGSISHTHGYAVAVVAPDVDGLVGVDVERVGRVTSALYRMVLTPTETRWLAGRTDEATVATALFAAKEAFYKAQFQRTAAWVNFGDVGSRLVDTDLFELHPATDLGALAAVRWPVQVRWGLAEGVVTAGVVVHPGTP